jgi:hypothetical protein
MIAKTVQLTNYLLRFYGIAHKTGLFVIGRYFLYPVELFLQFFNLASISVDMVIKLAQVV